MTGSSRSRCIGSLVLAPLMLLAWFVLVVPASAQQSPLAVGGVAECDASTGLIRVTFALTNQADDPVTITSATVTNVPGAGSVSVQPNPIPVGVTATGVAFVLGSTAVPVVLEVDYESGGATGETSGSVLAESGCVPRGTVSTSTTAAASPTSAARPNTEMSPSFTG